jgi:hypothetical protein
MGGVPPPSDVAWSAALLFIGFDDHTPIGCGGVIPVIYGSMTETQGPTPQKPFQLVEIENFLKGF